MNETSEAKKSRLRWVTLGEAIAIAALILSGLGLWHEWNKQDSKPVAERPASIPLALRGEVQNEGREIDISPIEDSHSLQSLTVTVAGKSIELGNNGELDSEDVADALGEKAGGGKGTHRLPVRITAKYVEAGADKSATGSYTLSYRWKDRLIGSPSLRLVALSR